MGALKTLKNHFVAWLGEFVGTFLFLFFAFAGTQTANQPTSSAQSQDGPNLNNLLYISLIFGFSLAVNVWVFFRVSGGLFNPAVTLALCITGVVPILRSLFILVAQILGGIAAAAVVRGIIPGNDVFFNVSLRPGVSVVQGLFLEMFLTTELVFTILMLAAEKTKATFVAPVGIGLALFVAELVGVYWTGGALNPARAFGPQVVVGNFPGTHWVYWVGPILGALLASAFYGLIKFLNYEEVNGTQDLTPEEEKDVDDDDAGNQNRSQTFDEERGKSQRSNRSQNRQRRSSDNDYDRNQRQRSPRGPPHYPEQQNKYYDPSQTERSPRAPPHYPDYENARPQTGNSSNGDPNRRSRVHRDPPSSRNNAQNQRAYSPPPVETPGGTPYIQDTEAQVRRDNRRSGGSVRNARKDMEEYERTRREKRK